MASASKDNTGLYVSQETTKRLVRDITDIYKQPLNDQGIYYQHDDTYMLKGYAMIIGPSDTPYENGMYLFEFNFPENYPQQPPVLKYMTQDGKTRFNPNLYVSGKVCLSVLNTWKGEGWTSCQTIRSILLTLITVLNDKPLLNEPGIREDHRDFKNYNTYITYKNFEIAINGMMTQSHLPNKFRMFFPFMKTHILKEKNNILNKMKIFLEKNKNKQQVYIDFYNMNMKMDIQSLIDKFENVIQAYQLK
jgi:ubiquitin-protein ligase